MKPEPQVEVFDVEAWPRAAAAAVAAEIRSAIAERGVCHLALSGGETPAPVYRALASEDVDWAQVEIWWGDERCVPADDPASNYGMARRTLLDALPRPPRAVHPMDGTAPPHEAAVHYAAALPAQLDVVLLGLGGDGHTASLFPSQPQPPPEATVAAVPGLSPPRLTLTLRALNAARVVLFLVRGESKAQIVARTLCGDDVPAAAVHGTRALRWLLDTQAAGSVG